MQTCPNNCSNHGTCISESCSCDLGFFHNSTINDCSISGLEEWGSSWSFFVIFFTILFSVTLLYSLRKLYSSLKKEKTSDCLNKCKRVIISPKNLSLLGVCVISSFKIVWLSFDPLIFHGKSNRMIDRLLFETNYPLMFTVLSSVLLVWASMYECISQRGRRNYRYIKRFIIFLMIGVYPFTWTLCINKGLRDEKYSWYWFGYIGLAVGSSFLSAFFVIFCFLLFRYLNKGVKDNENYIEIDIKGRSGIKAKTFTEEYQDILNGGSIVTSGIHLNTSSDIDRNTKKKYYIEVTKGDKKLIKKILVLTTICGISGLLIIAVGTPFTINGTLNKPGLTLFGIFLAFIFDLFICVLIIFTFSRQIANINKKNIKNMFYMARKNRKKNPIIKISNEFETIAKRLQLYYM